MTIRAQSTKEPQASFEEAGVVISIPTKEEPEKQKAFDARRAITSTAINDAGNLIAISTYVSDGNAFREGSVRIELYDLSGKRGKRLRDLEMPTQTEGGTVHHTKETHDLKFSPDGAILYGVHAHPLYKGGISVWDTTTGKMVRWIAEGRGLRHFAFNPLCTGRIMNLNREVPSVPERSLRDVPAALAVPSGTGGWSSTAIEFRDADDRIIGMPVKVCTYLVLEMQFTADGSSLVAHVLDAGPPRDALTDGDHLSFVCVVEWENKTKQWMLRRRWRVREGISSLAVSPDSSRIAIGHYTSEPNSIEVFDKMGKKVSAIYNDDVHHVRSLTESVDHVSFLPTGQLIASQCASTRIWNVATKASLSKLHSSLACRSRDGKALILRESERGEEKLRLFKRVEPANASSPSAYK